MLTFTDDLFEKVVDLSHEGANRPVRQVQRMACRGGKTER